MNWELLLLLKFLSCHSNSKLWTVWLTRISDPHQLQVVKTVRCDLSYFYWCGRCTLYEPWSIIHCMHVWPINPPHTQLQNTPYVHKRCIRIHASNLIFLTHVKLGLSKIKNFSSKSGSFPVQLDKKFAHKYFAESVRYFNKSSLSINYEYKFW